MCGRFVGYRNIEQLKAYLPVDRVACEAAANYNVAPTQKILAVIRQERLNILDKLHWGLVPFWAKDPNIGVKMINARQETVATKPSFREAFKKRRCLIPADGFYEWTGPRGHKQPILITLPEGAPFAFAGLWETWREKAAPEKHHRSCTIITRDATPSVKAIHNRMPVILAPEAYAAWLSRDAAGTESLQELLTRHAVTELVYYPVSKQVNSAGHNEPSNIVPIHADLGV